MKARTVCIDARMLRASGIGTYLQGLLTGLKDLAPDGYSWSLLGNPQELPAGPWMTRKASAPIYSLREQIEIPWLFRAQKSVLLHAPHYNVPVLNASRTVVTVHDVIHLKFPQFWPSAIARAYARFFFYRVIPKAKAILTVSENTKRDLMEMLSIQEDRITVTYHGVNHERFRTKDPALLTELRNLGLPKDYLLYVGNLKEFKNVPLLVKAYESLCSMNKDSPPLVLVGRNFIPGFDRVIKSIKGIYWLGEVRRELLPSLYQNALVFLFPSLYEGFGLPPLEAMASGTPVLCSNRASLPEVVGEAALMIDPENVEEMTAAMKRLVEDSLLRKELSEKGLRQAARFSWRRMAEQTLEVYAKCLAEI